MRRGGGGFCALPQYARGSVWAAGLLPILATFTLAHGCLVWVVGIAMLGRAQRWRALAGWCALGGLALVVFFHGYGHTAENWTADLERVAAQDHVIALAMDYRGNVHGTPNHGWRVAEGAADSIAAARGFDKAGPRLTTIGAYGVSMGCNA